MSRDLYSVLELQKGADASEIKKSYYKLSKQWHPDKAPPGKDEEYTEKFKEISAAYEVLSDSEKKSYYDQTGRVPGEEGPNPFGGGGGGGGGMPFPFDIPGMFGMFGGRNGPSRCGRRNGKAPPRKTQIPLTLKDFYYGRKLDINITRQRFCTQCKGEGSTNVKMCGDCNGQGVKVQMIHMGPMIMQSHGPCPSCNGNGKMRGDNCSSCSGSKFMKQDKTVELHIPKGSKPGNTSTYPGESSNVEEYEEAGDLVIELVAADEDILWERIGDDLKINIQISLAESICGKIVELANHPGYPDGLFVKLPQGVQNGHSIVVEGSGMPIMSGGFGKCILVVAVVPSESERQLLIEKESVLRELFGLPPQTVVAENIPVQNAKSV